MSTTLDKLCWEFGVWGPINKQKASIERRHIILRVQPEQAGINFRVNNFIRFVDKTGSNVTNRWGGKAWWLVLLHQDGLDVVQLMFLLGWLAVGITSSYLFSLVLLNSCKYFENVSIIYQQFFFYYMLNN